MKPLLFTKKYNIRNWPHLVPNKCITLTMSRGLVLYFMYLNLCVTGISISSRGREREQAAPRNQFDLTSK